jgi:S1-C subfamily serine protease
VLDPAGGAPLGAAVAVAPRRALTSAHVARAAAAGGADGAIGGRIRLQLGDGSTEVAGKVLAVSERVDLALLELPDGSLTPALAAPAAPAAGEPVWAVGPHRLGRAVAAGSVVRPAAAVDGLGEGFVARLPALMGYSGGPVVDRSGRLVGITTAALDEALGAHLLALLLGGADWAGLAFGDGRRIFVLGLASARAELRRLAAPEAGAGGDAAAAASGRHGGPARPARPATGPSDPTVPVSPPTRARRQAATVRPEGARGGRRKDAAPCACTPSCSYGWC